MSHPRHYDESLYTHFITFSCYHRRRLLDHDQPKRIFLGVLNVVREKFVLMPDHVHLLIWFPQPQQLSRFIQQLKSRSSTQLKRFVREHLTRYAAQVDNDDPVWQVRFHSFEVYSLEKLAEKLAYMHMNPVRAGLVKRTIDWPWSSARWYEERRTVGLPIDWVD